MAIGDKPSSWWGKGLDEGCCNACNKSSQSVFVVHLRSLSFRLCPACATALKRQFIEAQPETRS